MTRLSLGDLSHNDARLELISTLLATISWYNSGKPFHSFHQFIKQF